MKRIINILTLTLICSMIAPVFAVEEEKITDVDLIDQSLAVVSYDVHNSIHNNILEISREIIRYAPDIVGFQGIYKITEQANEQDQTKLLAEKAGYPYYQFTKATDYQGGEYGHAILSRYPIVSHEATMIPSFKADQEVRALSHAVIDVNGTHVNFFNTHINGGSDGTSQHAFDKIAEVVTKFDNAILTGDFNAEYSTGYFDTFKGFKCVNIGNHYTANLNNGNSIDNICYTKEFTVLYSGTSGTLYGNHRLVCALFTFKRK